MLAAAARSVDGGATFAHLAGAPEIDNSASIAPAADDTAVLATGNETQLLRTTDGGATFRQVFPRQPGWWMFLGFTDPSTGTGLRAQPSGRTLLERGTDGGATWRVVPVR
jgi:photosystem II stability/assembly factor-like uncharacterized protein